MNVLFYILLFEFFDQMTISCCLSLLLILISGYVADDKSTNLNNFCGRLKKRSLSGFGHFLKRVSLGIIVKVKSNDLNLGVCETASFLWWAAMTFQTIDLPLNDLKLLIFMSLFLRPVKRKVASLKQK